MFLGLQAECRRIDAIVTQHETTLPRLSHKVETSSRRVNTVLLSVEERMREFETWINEVRKSNINTEIPMEMVNSLNKIIQDSALSAVVKVMRQQVRELSQVIQNDQFVTDSLRGLVVDLQEKFNAATPQGVLTLTSSSGNLSPQTSGMRSSPDNQSSREREIVRKGIERLVKQIFQFINIFIPCEQTNKALQKCKTVDIPAMNSVIGNIPKALQKYIGFSGMDPGYCDGIGELIEELYKKVEVHSINTSKGDASDVGVFSDNSQVTVFEFLESAELAYLGWGNSVQKANRLYNKHLSDEI